MDISIDNKFHEGALRHLICLAPDDNIHFEDVMSVAKESLGERGGAIMHTIADSLIDKGKQQGMREGIQLGIIQKSREAIIEVLDIRFGLVTRSIIKTLNGISEPELLGMLHRNAVRTESIEDFARDVNVSLR
ncbi:MAG: hypothetical protein GY859_13250 [Desulfobacterales bacterium]|nr:hypothetical protein [Desulfobacterales bacterium]